MTIGLTSPSPSLVALECIYRIAASKKVQHDEFQNLKDFKNEGILLKRSPYKHLDEGKRVQITYMLDMQP